MGDGFIVNKFSNLLLFVFRPSKLIDKCVESSILGVAPKDMQSNRESFRKQYQKSVYSLRMEILKGFITMSIIVIFAMVSSLILSAYQIIGNYLVIDIKYLKIIGPCFLIWAVYGKFGVGINTHSGKSIPESINDFWFKSLYCIGMYITLTINLL